MSSPPAPIPDLDALLVHSQPRRNFGYLPYAAGIFLLLIMGGTLAQTASPELRGLYELFSAFLMFGLMVAMAARMAYLARAHRAEMARLEGIEELLQLRRWPEAAAELRSLLSQPTRTPQARIQALLYLATLLGRYHHFDDAVRVADYLLEHVQLDPAGEYAVRLARAMSLLREDRLVDADRALSELKRLRSSLGAAEDTYPTGLALLELYRDVKTGHPYDALDLFDKYRPAFARDLGHRAADAYCLAAKAADQVGRPDDAAALYRSATLLSPPDELHRRYPETDTLPARYAPCPIPAEAR